MFTRALSTMRGNVQRIIYVYITGSSALIKLPRGDITKREDSLSSHANSRMQTMPNPSHRIQCARVKPSAAIGSDRPSRRTPTRRQGKMPSNLQCRRARFHQGDTRGNAQLTNYRIAREAILRNTTLGLV